MKNVKVRLGAMAFALLLAAAVVLSNMAVYGETIPGAKAIKNGAGSGDPATDTNNNKNNKKDKNNKSDKNYVPYEEEGEWGPSIFDREYIQRLFDGFLTNGETQVDIFQTSNGNPISEYQHIINLDVYKINDDMAFNIDTDKGIWNPKSKIINAMLYSTTYDTDEDYGFAQIYKYDKKGNITVNNIIYVGPAYSNEVIGHEGLSNEDFYTNVATFMETPLRERKEVFDKIYEELGQKYD